MSRDKMETTESLSVEPIRKSREQGAGSREPEEIAPGNAKLGFKVKGSIPPFGGRWSYDPAKDELTLIEEATRDSSRV